jgi:predicted PurR-regulated permease PerM
VSDRRRLFVLVGMLALVAIAAAAVLRSVFATVFFAVTVAYVLYPVRQFLARRGLGRRVAAGVSTTLAFAAVLVLAVPLGAALYLRRETLFDLFLQLPDTVTLAVGGFSYSLELGTALTALEDAAGSLAASLALQLPALALKVFLFALVVYALLIRPGRVGEALLRPVPEGYHDVVLAFHARTRSILYGIYVLQAAVAAATFAVALLVFFLLGYDSWFTLAVLSGILQFIPVLGPSILVVAIGVTEVLLGNVDQAALVVVIGLTVVGFLPDALIRPRLAGIATDMPASLYFIGFTGGTLSVGLVGIVAGPVVVAWLSEAVSLLSAETATGRATTVDEWAAAAAPGSDATGEPGADPDPEPEPDPEPDAARDPGADLGADPDPEPDAPPED